MKSKRKTQIPIALLLFFIAIAVLGILLLIFACHGECGSDVHGGMLTYVCPKFFFPRAGTVVIIVVGAIGAIAVGSYLLFGAKSERMKAEKMEVGWFGKQLDKNIKEVCGDNYSALPWVFCVFAENCDKTKLMAAKALCKTLDTLSFDNIIRIDEQMRQTTSVEWSIEWRKFNINDFYTPHMSLSERRAVIIFASFNSNGFIREKAVQLMKDYDGTLPYIILRQNDWVNQVRQAAAIAFTYRLQHLSEGEMLSSLPFAEKLKRSNRDSHNESINQFFSALTEPEHLQDLISGLENENIRTRRICTEALFNEKSPKIELAFERLIYEPKPFLRAMIFRKLNGLGQKMDKVIEIFLRDKYPVNRMLAFRYILDMKADNVYEIAERLLLDKNTTVREAAQSVVQKQSPNYDFRKFYLNGLDLHTAAAINGLGEKGLTDDASKVEGYLNDKRICVVKAAMVSLMRLNKEKYSLPITDMLDDSRAGVVKTARNLLLKSTFPNYQRIKDIFQKTEFEHSKLKCMDILFAAPKWSSIIYMLEIMSEKEEYIKEKTLDAIKRWLMNFNRSFISPSEVQVKEIRQLIQKLNNILPPDIQRNLLFGL